MVGKKNSKSKIVSSKKKSKSKSSNKKKFLKRTNISGGDCGVQIPKTLRILKVNQSKKTDIFDYVYSLIIWDNYIESIDCPEDLERVALLLAEEDLSFEFLEIIGVLLKNQAKKLDSYNRNTNFLDLNITQAKALRKKYNTKVSTKPMYYQQFAENKEMVLKFLLNASPSEKYNYAKIYKNGKNINKLIEILTNATS